MNIGTNFYFRDEAYAIMQKENQKLIESIIDMTKEQIRVNSAIADILAEKNSALAEKDSALAEKDSQIRELEKYSFIGVIRFFRHLRNYIF